MNDGYKTRNAPSEGTCGECGDHVWWIGSENRWNASDNDHSWCDRSADHKHHVYESGVPAWQLDAWSR